MKLKFFLFTGAFFLLMAAMPATLSAQELFDVDKIPYPPQNAEQSQAQNEEQPLQEEAETAPQQQADRGPPRFDMDSFPSLIFTYWELASIQDSKNSRGMTRPPTQEEIVQEENEAVAETPPEPGIRTIVLGGIAFKTADNWTIWLNDQRVTPTAIPKEVLDLKVYENYIEIKWFDEYKNQIVPIRIRPHQRFNLDSRIFLPG